MSEAVEVKRSDGPAARVAQTGESAGEAVAPLREGEF
jgi:hypothetical protein